MSDNHHEEAHTGPIKTPKQLLLAVAYSFILPVFIIIGLVTYVGVHFKQSPGASSLPEATAERIQKVGMVEIRDANRPLRAGEEVFKAQCSACHATGAAGAPKFQDAGAWAARIKTGYDALLNSALKGKGAMGAQGGGDFDDVEVAARFGDYRRILKIHFHEPLAIRAAVLSEVEHHLPLRGGSFLQIVAQVEERHLEPGGNRDFLLRVRAGRQQRSHRQGKA